MNHWIISRAKSYYYGPVSRDAIANDPEVDAATQWQVCIQQAVRDYRAYRLRVERRERDGAAKRAAFFETRKAAILGEQWRAKLAAVPVRAYSVRAVERIDEGGRKGWEYYACDGNPAGRKGAA